MIDELLEQMIDSCASAVLQKRRPKKPGAYVMLFLTLTDMVRSSATLNLQYRQDFSVDLQQTYDIKTEYIVYVGLLLSSTTQHAIFKERVFKMKNPIAGVKHHYAINVVPSMKGPCCHYCFEATKLMKCTKCNDAHYCSAECQRYDWIRHKMECTAFANAKCEVENQFDPSVMVSVPINFQSVVANSSK